MDQFSIPIVLKQINAKAINDPYVKYVFLTKLKAQMSKYLI